MKEEGENMEKWKPLIIDNEISKYEISDFGRIKSFHNPKKVKILKSYETNSGYQTICLVHKKRKYGFCFIELLQYILYLYQSI